MTREQILAIIKEELIFKRLKLEKIGIALEDIKDDTKLFGSESLDLSSVDILELAIGIQQKFNIKLGKISEAEAKIKFSTPNSLADYILELQQKNSK